MKNKNDAVQVFQGALAVGGIVLSTHYDCSLAFNTAIVASVITSLISVKASRSPLNISIEKFRDDLNTAIKSETGNSSFASTIYVGSIDVTCVDGFASDDRYGYREMLLNRIDKQLRDHKNISSSCRGMGDTFHILTHASTLTEAKDFFNEVHANIIRSSPWKANQISVKVVIGFSNLDWNNGEANSSSSSSGQLMSNADIAKLAGQKNGVLVQEYNESFASSMKDKFLLEYDLTNSIKDNQMKLLYQPKVSSVDEKIESLEVLCRWHHPKRGLISPSFFIPLAEETGCINEIGAFVIENAIRDLAEVIEETGNSVGLAINISIKQFEHNNGLDLKRQLFDSCCAYGIPHNLIQLEVTETAAARDIGSIVTQLQFFKDEGFGISLDDFGVGYSSLLRLKSLPLTQVKIDRAFVVDKSQSGLDLLASIVDISKKMQVEIVAEGVETREQAETLKKMKCDYIQGFLYSKPTTKDNIIEMIRDGRRLGGK